MKEKKEAWYIHAGLIVVAAILVYLLIQVVVISPNKYLAEQEYWEKESHARMDNLRQAEILWQKKHDRFTDDLDSLIHLLKTDKAVFTLVDSVDTLTNRSLNPFNNLTEVKPFTNENGDTIYNWQPDSLLRSPKSNNRYILKVDTTIAYDSTFDRRGRLRKVDTVITVGQRYLLECPDKYGTIGDIFSDALKNVASWE